MMIVDCSAYGPGSGVRPARRDSETYTPGPWIVCPKNNPPSQENPRWMEGVTIYSESTGKRVADTCWLNSSNDHNARLIAAAPDLLAELKQCALEAEEAANLIRPNFPRAADLFSKAAQRSRAAIAKAEGAGEGALAGK